MAKSNKFIADTNTLISSLLLKNSISFAAFEKARNTGTILFSEDTFFEFELVLLRTKFDKYFSKQERLYLIEKVHEAGKFISVTSQLKVCRDPKDDKFLNLALDAKASCIITGDKDLLILHPFNKINILTPAQFVNKAY